VFTVLGKLLYFANPVFFQIGQSRTAVISFLPNLFVQK